jgi:hypothetical protein
LKSISLNDRPQTTGGPDESVFEEACKATLEEPQVFVLSPMEKGYMGPQLKLTVIGLRAKRVNRPTPDKVFGYTAQISVESDVQSGEEGITEVEGYFSTGKHPDGHVWLRVI